MMGLGNKNDFFNEGSRDPVEAKDDRDPLNFLKKSDQVKKE